VKVKGKSGVDLVGQLAGRPGIGVPLLIEAVGGIPVIQYGGDFRRGEIVVAHPANVSKKRVVRRAAGDAHDGRDEAA